MTTKIEKGFLLASGETVRSPDADANALQITYGDKVLTVELSEIPKAVLQCAMLHGLSQKIGDAASGYAQQGLNPIDMMGATVEQLKAGHWNKPNTGGNGGGQVSLLAEALSRVADKPLELCVDAVDGLSDEQKKELRKRPAMKAAIAQIQSERKAAQAKATADAAKSDNLEDVLKDLF